MDCGFGGGRDPQLPTPITPRFSFKFETQLDAAYRIDATNDLSPEAEWTKIGSVQGNGGLVEFTDTRKALFPMQFYRVVLVTSTQDPFTIPELDLEMMPIPAGTFVMGSPADETGRGNDEGPQTTVTITKPFWLGKTEVTQEQWKAVMGNTPSRRNGDDLPVESVSWNDAVAFCEKLNEMKRATLPVGYHYTLPTEAQWEYACRAGTTTRFYHGDDPGHGQLQKYAWYADNSSRKTHPVGEKLPNGWGLHDMHGNVWEWCLDRYGDYPGGPSFSVSDPQGPQSGAFRVYRGGAWSNNPSHCRSANRLMNRPVHSFNSLGFRVALSSVPIPTEDPFTIPELDLKMMPIPAGTFVMGSPNEETDLYGPEGPQTELTISKPFWLGQTEVTQGQWQAVMGNTPSDFKGNDLPVERVTWFDAMAFCEKLNEMKGDTLPAGYHYTLPTEAQWEYACRAGTTTRFYHGDDPAHGQLQNYAWYAGNSSSKTHPAGQKLPNEWGLHDMHGNVWEWCLDWYGNYTGGSVSDPEGPLSGSFRIIRGGSWNDFARDCRSGSRIGVRPDYSNDLLGFRVALSSV
ncbi:MAG: formylglycine-generating enzyme family protein, partial [Verrucomicrobiota bacterium]|nr:formylglycine-generating enzyme family protein [Verrucomicrobiota bacterium]